MLVAAAIMLAQVTTISNHEPLRPTRTAGHGICFFDDSTRVSIDFENDWVGGQRGKVTRVMMGGKELPGVAADMTALAQNRGIVSILTVQCGPGNRVSGIMMLSQADSARKHLPSLQPFKFDRNGLIK